MRVMGLDYGTKTVGVAISDLLGLTAQGIETIRYEENSVDTVMLRLQELIHEYEVEQIVVGLPKNMNGSIGERAQAATEFANAIEARFELPVTLWDERLTTMAAEKMLISADVSRKKRKKVIDKMAAVMILQGYLYGKGGL